MRASIRIVLNMFDATWDAVFVSFKVNNSVVSLMPATFVSGRNSTVIIPTPGI
jgi:hypothetical protein